MTHLVIYTSKQDYTLNLGVGIYIKLRCEYMPWLWNAYELLNIEPEYCSDDELMIKYLSTYRKLREERNVKLIMNLRNEMMRIRAELRKSCKDELICLANRLYEYNRAVNALYKYYMKIHELDPERKSKLSIAFNKYNMPAMGLRVFNELLYSSNEELKYLTFLSLLNPVRWPLHITMNTNIVPYLNWILIYLDDHYIILMASLNRAYVISDLNVNINGGKVTLDNDYETRSIMTTHIITRIESVDGHGVLFIGNWSDQAINLNLDFKPREGSIKGTSLDANISQLIPIIIPPHDYLSIKYTI
ncbi:MAG: hypothetical protein ACP5GZ_00685 [Vulcanisaeta sp.]|jgi:hypothetical protein|uniref:hypothetical protein n=1 Tax=Vulcanisaeta sp. TaxID=2020871 RepID=UPI003D0EB0A4